MMVMVEEEQISSEMWARRLVLIDFQSLREEAKFLESAKPVQ